MSRTIKEGFALAVSVAALAAAFHFPALSFLAFIAFVPIFFCLEEKTSGQAFKRLFFTGFFYHVLMAYWLNYVNVAGFLVLAAYLSLYFAFFGLWCRPHLTSTRLRSALFIAALWTTLEYARGYLFSGFPWALLGHSQWKSLPVIQMADTFGSYGVSFFVMWVNVVAYQIVRPMIGSASLVRPIPSKRHLLWLISVFAIVLGYGFWQLRTREAFYAGDRPRAELSLSVLQGNIPQEQKWDAKIKGIIFEKYKRLTLMAAMEKADLVVWPETSFPGYIEDEPVMAAQLRNAVRHAHTSVLVGAPTISDLEKEKLRFYNSAILYTPNGEEAGRYHKEHLVPFGEYIPLETALGFLRHLVAIGNFSPGAEGELFSIVSRYRPSRIAAKFSTLICYEDMFPGIVRERCKAGADFLVNISNDAWFGKTAAPYQHAQSSVFRAVENRVPVVRATNTGYSCFITAEGRIRSAVQTNGEEIMVSGYKTDTIVLRKGRPFYTQAGDLLFGLMLVLLWMAYRDKHKNSGYSRI